VSDRGLTTNDDLDYVHEFEHITLARTLLAGATTSTIDATTGFLDRLFAAAEAGRREGSAVELLVLQSLAHQAKGDAAAAAAMLDKAVTRAAADGYVRVFLDAGPRVPALLRTIGLSGAAGEHARLVLVATASASPVSSTGQGLVDELSGRELDVLRLLRSDLSGPDIARELLVSLNTFRTHTKNIYAKLGVNNRREAIRRAAELGL
jgi:LuxR family maltose regulon positive regulatory protein